MQSFRPVLLSAAILGLVSPVHAEETFAATLAGHALIPATTFIAPPPADAPKDAAISGKFAGAARVMEPESVMGDTGAAHGKRSTGIMLPFKGQPLQGLSGFAIATVEDGSIFVLTDNGFGSKTKSPDALLFFQRMKPDFESGAVDVKETVFLRAPDFKVPFRIAHEGIESRYLTGADFDTERIQVLNGEVWIGYEFGPCLIRAGLDGRVLGVHPTRLGDTVLKGPDTPGISAMSVMGKDWTVQRSGGHQGMALQPGMNPLWGTLEKPLLGEDGKPEDTFLRALAFDPARGDWTGGSFNFALAEGATAIGDFNFIDETRALVIERDNGEGLATLKCAEDPMPDRFPAPAMLKRVVLIDTAALDAEGFARRIGHIDLMAIADPEGKARLETAGGVAGTFTFPFFTIENLMPVDNRHITLAVDNNLPYSSGRALDKAADNEFILLSVPELLAAR